MDDTLKQVREALVLGSKYSHGAAGQKIDAAIAALDAEPVAPSAESDAGKKAMELLEAVFDAWENGDPCYEDPDEHGGFLGMAFRLPDDVFNDCCDLLNAHFGHEYKIRNATPPAQPAQVQVVPEGWKLVPINPTPEMMQAGFDIPGSHAYGLTYRAMIAAAPALPQQGEKEALRLMEQKAAAFDEWIEKTNWVQEQMSTFPVKSLGMHRADVMREEIERLRAAALLSSREESKPTGQELGWISVKDQQPEEKQNVLACHRTDTDGVPDLSVAVGRLDNDGWKVAATFYSIKGARDGRPFELRETKADVDFWMPLPVAHGKDGGA